MTSLFDSLPRGLAEHGVAESRSGDTSRRDTDAGRPDLAARSLHVPCSASLIDIHELRDRIVRDRRAASYGAASYPFSSDDVEALLDVLEAAQDFLAEEYPAGTDHPADAAADRLARRVARFK